VSRRDGDVIRGLARAGLHASNEKWKGRWARAVPTIRIVDLGAGARLARGVLWHGRPGTPLVADASAAHPARLSPVGVSIARRADVVICRDLPQAMAMGHLGVRLHRVHLVPPVYPLPGDDEVEAAESWSSSHGHDPQGLIICSPSAATATDADALVLPTDNSARRALELVRNLVRAGASVITTADDLDLDPWAVISVGSKPVIAGTPHDSVAADVVTRDLTRLSAAISLADWRETSASRKQPTPFSDRLVRLAWGRHGTEAVTPRYVHAIVSALRR
jgi:hypothetical protein